MTVFQIPHDAPPSLDGQPVYTMLVLVGILTGTLLCMRWLFLEIAEAKEDPFPWRHAVTANRMVKIIFNLAGLIVTLPRLVMVMGWGYLGPVGRTDWAIGSWLVYAAWAVLLATAWTIDSLSRESVYTQLIREPDPLQPAPAKRKKNEAIVTLGLIIMVAFAVTYIRPSGHYDAPSIHRDR